MATLKITIFILWIASFAYWGLYAFEHQALQQESQSELDNRLARSLSSNQPSSNTNESNISNSLGIFGKVEIQKAKILPTAEIKKIDFSPINLQGTFIKDNKVWAIVSNETNEAIIMEPEEIKAFNSSSITILTNSGIKSLHLKSNTQGIYIRDINKITKSSVSTETQKLSRAQQLRLKLLSSSKPKSP